MEKNKTEIYYLDEEHNIVDAEKATEAIIRELDDKGNLVSENYMQLKKEEKVEEKEYTEEEIEIFKKLNFNLDGIVSQKTK